MENMDDAKKEKLKERFGVFLLCLILILSGLILVKDNNSKTEIKENILQKQNAANNSSSESEKLLNPGSSQQTSNSKTEAKININKASIEELDTLPGIGEKTAQKIMDYRKSTGGFKNIEELKEVSGIGEAKFSQVKDLISI